VALPRLHQPHTSNTYECTTISSSTSPTRIWPCSCLFYVRSYCCWVHSEIRVISKMHVLICMSTSISLVEVYLSYLKTCNLGIVLMLQRHAMMEHAPTTYFLDSERSMLQWHAMVEHRCGDKERRGGAAGHGIWSWRRQCEGGVWEGENARERMGTRENGEEIRLTCTIWFI
jgi:hypothetical protein